MSEASSWDSTSEDSSEGYYDNLTDDECAIAGARLKRTRHATTIPSTPEDAGAMARSSSSCSETVPYRDMEPVHYRLLEGTYLASLEFSLSQIPPGDVVTFLLRPENQISEEQRSEDWQIDGTSAAAATQPSGGDSAEAKDSTPDTVQIQLTASDAPDVSDGKTMECDFEHNQENGSPDSNDREQNDHFPQHSQNPGSDHDGDDQKGDADIVTAKNSDGHETLDGADTEAAPIIDTTPGDTTPEDTTAENTTTNDTTINDTTINETTTKDMDGAQDEPEQRHEASTPQTALPLVVPINGQFEVRNMSMGGSGAFARRDLKLNDVILVEKHILTGNGFTMHKQFRTLDALGQRVYLCLHPHWPKDEQRTNLLTAILHTNSFSTHGGKGVFPVASRFNHKCRDKCNLRFHYDTKRELLVVYVGVEHISAGEELTISYGGNPQTLYQRYGFFCSCGGCDGFSQTQADALEKNNWV